MNSPKRDDDPTESNHSFKAYPNPVTDKLVLEFPLEDDTQTISVFDNLGRLVLSKYNSAQRTELNVADFSAGLYLVRVFGAHSNQTFSIIKK